MTETAVSDGILDPLLELVNDLPRERSPEPAFEKDGLQRAVGVRQ